IHLAKYFRTTNINIELLKKDNKYSLEDYIAYGKRMDIGGILYFGTPDIVQIYDIDKGTNIQVNINDLMLGDDE
ncbi:MAG: ATP phosphoribosyltransferase regulatory subunit, partial [Clostridiales bacterium]|nr:ATP phosphoribosyltransferase regulatory subunit [Clostridiales bacterium]